MQGTPQCSLAGLDASSLRSLQRLRDVLQELPKRFLRGESQEDEGLLGTVSGDSNWSFTLRVEGGGCFQTGMLVAEGRKAGSSLPVPLRCTWKRKIGDVTVEIPGVTTNMYQISADDVGTLISVEAKPADDDSLFGVMVGEIGPFELDPATRWHLDNALGEGGGEFRAWRPPERSFGDLPRGDEQGQEVVINVTAEGVRATFLEQRGTRPAAGQRSSELLAEYSAEYPKVIIHPLDATNFNLLMNERKSFTLRATSRASRDLIALTIRCFHANKYVPMESVLTEILPLHGPDPAEQGAADRDGRFETVVRLERLLAELCQAMQRKETQDKILRNTRNEKKDLQDQLMESISGCTDVIVGLQDQVSDGGETVNPAAAAERLREQLQEAQATERALRRDAAAAKERLEAVRATLRQAEELSPEIQRCTEERDMLKARLSDLTSSSSAAKQLDQADQTHAMELKRLRQDVEALHNRKEELRKEFQDKEAEKEDLQQNFFFVKSQLDKCQLRVAQDASGEAAGQELDRHGQTLTNARDERTRLSSRLETVLREQEKEKVYHEQQIDRITQTNAKLHEEKDRVSREVQRLSRMYADAVEQLQAGSQSRGMGHPDAEAADLAGGSAPADPEEVRRLRGALRERRAKLQAKQEECESLRTRIRKLAVD